jgi:carbohydrate diacid regulator
MTFLTLMPEAPRIGDELRSSIVALHDEPWYLVEHCYSAVMRVHGYEKLGLSERKEVFHTLELVVGRWCSLVLGLGDAFPNQIEQLEASIRRRVHQGISLESALCAFRSSVKELWLAHLGLGEHDHALRDELLFVVSPYLLEYADSMMRFIQRVFLDEQLNHTLQREEMRRQLGEMVFSGNDEDQDFSRLARGLGFDTMLPRIALAIDYELTERSKSDTEAALDRLASGIAQVMKVPADEVVHVTQRGRRRRARLIVWLPCTGKSSLISNQRALAGAIVDYTKQTPEIRAIGVGLMNHGLSGWAASADEANTALDFLAPRRNLAKVAFYADIVIDESIRANRSALRYFEAMLEEILHERDLLKTLECYFSNRQQHKSTAAELGIHTNTLRYRLDRIEMLLGAELDTPHWMAQLFIALRLHNVGGVGADANIVDLASSAND